MTEFYSNSKNNFEKKVNEFMQAIEKYNNGRYKRFEILVSFLIIMLQTTTLFNLLYTYNNISYIFLTLALMMAYVATDFINGLVHMYMDNNTHYNSIAGPYIAAFHLHHAKYSYHTRPLLKVYFDESGTKFWLLVYLIFLVVLQSNFRLNIYFNIGLVAFGFFSSVAELSHYLCHNASEKNKLILWLQNNYLLLSKEHHKDHHRFDNIQYAFLNGMTDPLINLIAHHCYNGYKNNADKHTRAYMLQIMK